MLGLSCNRFLLGKAKMLQPFFVFMSNTILQTYAYLYKSFMTLFSFKKEQIVYKTCK